MCHILFSIIQEEIYYPQQESYPQDFGPWQGSSSWLSSKGACPTSCLETPGVNRNLESVIVVCRDLIRKTKKPKLSPQNTKDAQHTIRGTAIISCKDFSASETDKKYEITKVCTSTSASNYEVHEKISSNFQITWETKCYMKDMQISESQLKFSFFYLCTRKEKIV